MNSVPMEKIMMKGSSVYKMVIVAAKRALEISNGLPRLVECSTKEKPSMVALREIAAGKVALKVKKKPKDG